MYKAYDYGTYTLAVREKVTFDRLKWATKPLIDNHKCIKCPAGGDCDKDVRAEDNH